MTSTQLSPEKHAMHDEIATAQKEAINEISDAMELVSTAIDMIPLDTQLNSKFGSHIYCQLSIAVTRMASALNLLEETAPADAILIADEAIQRIAKKLKNLQ